MWKTETPDPQPTRSVMDNDPVNLSVTPANNQYKQWQCLLLSFGALSDQPHEECLKTWPREALQLAREKLDQFEEQLDKESLDGLHAT